MAFMQKTVTMTYETLTISANTAKAVRKIADNYLRTVLPNISKLVTVLKVTYVSTVSTVETVRNKEYTAYRVTYTFDVEAPATDIASKAIEGAMQLPTRRKKGESFFLLTRKAV